MAPAVVAPIIRNGGDWFARIGTGTSKGTTLREIVHDIGGGSAGSAVVGQAPVVVVQLSVARRLRLLR